MNEPVPQNSCGSCVVCCHALSFNAKEGYKKAAGEMCRHCTGSGCGIYETRYQLCRIFHCGWRKQPLLGENWRPDRSGVLLIELDRDELPEAYRAAGAGMEFMILTDEQALLRPGFADYVATLVGRKVAVFMSLVGRPRTVINPFLEGLAAAGDIAGLTKMLAHLYKLHLEAKRQGIEAPDKPKAG
ncbi:MAG TPA: hypothetical protein VG501_09600 [Rhizomicrobium sp.]|nr:hypothetical protein [Rhizomicrobium sp.]